MSYKQKQKKVAGKTFEKESSISGWKKWTGKIPKDKRVKMLLSNKNIKEFYWKPTEESVRWVSIAENKGVFLRKDGTWRIDTSMGIPLPSFKTKKEAEEWAFNYMRQN